MTHDRHATDAGRKTLGGRLRDLLRRFARARRGAVAVKFAVIALPLAVLSLGSAESPLTCRNQAGAWALRPHSAAQIVAVGEDGKAWVVKCRQHLAALRAEIDGATTARAVLAMVWRDPA